MIPRRPILALAPAAAIAAGNYLVGDTACITAYTSRIESHGAVKPLWPAFDSWFTRAAGPFWF